MLNTARALFTMQAVYYSGYLVCPEKLEAEAVGAGLELGY